VDVSEAGDIFIVAALLTAMRPENWDTDVGRGAVPIGSKAVAQVERGGRASLLRKQRSDCLTWGRSPMAMRQAENRCRLLNCLLGSRAPSPHVLDGAVARVDRGIVEVARSSSSLPLPRLGCTDGYSRLIVVVASPGCSNDRRGCSRAAAAAPSSSGRIRSRSGMLCRNWWMGG
jgi:hypothetical protein